MAHPWSGSRARILRRRRSKVPLDEVGWFAHVSVTEVSIRRDISVIKASDVNRQPGRFLTGAANPL